jgi:4-hydroxy-tetrahydrodipicolinate reductase
MGRRLVALAAETEPLKLAAAWEHAANPAVGTDTGVLAGIGPNGLPLAAQPAADVDVVIDFTLPQALRSHLDHCTRHGLGIVIGTTGLTPDDHAAIDEAARTIPIVQAPNMSLGVNLLLGLVAQAARQLGDDYDIEILEAHHRFKKDAPSGTAMGLAEAICHATGKTIADDLIYTRYGHDDQRQRGKITMQTLRMGDVVGEHTVFFATQGERLELTHKASSRDTFARGALRAALWLHGRPAGRYTMKDVLGLA